MRIKRINYYFAETCQCCGHTRNKHIGKSTHGWCFAVNGMEFPSWEAWKKFLSEQLTSKPGTSIVDHDGNSVSFDDFIDIVEKRSGTWKELNAEFLHQAHAIQGPNGLLRCPTVMVDPITELSCKVEHGSGTWDVVFGTFS